MTTPTPSLYERTLGESYPRLAFSIQRFHRLAGRHELRGWVTTEAPASLPARLLARLLGTPTEASSGPIRFALEAHAARETWTRHFPTRTMTSTLTQDGGYLVERLGASCLLFELVESRR